MFSFILGCMITFMASVLLIMRHGSFLQGWLNEDQPIFGRRISAPPKTKYSLKQSTPRAIRDRELFVKRTIEDIHIIREAVIQDRRGAYDEMNSDHVDRLNRLIILSGDLRNSTGTKYVYDSVWTERGIKIFAPQTRQASDDPKLKRDVLKSAGKALDTLLDICQRQPHIYDFSIGDFRWVPIALKELKILWWETNTQ